MSLLRKVIQIGSTQFSRIPHQNLMKTSFRYVSNSINEIDFTVADSNKSNQLSEELKNPFEKDKVVCILCKMKIKPDYKNVKLLSQFVSSFTGKVYGRHITGLCKEKQKMLELEIEKARQAGLMPFYFKDPTFSHDPELFDPERPLRNHPY